MVPWKPLKGKYFSEFGVNQKSAFTHCELFSVFPLFLLGAPCHLLQQGGTECLGSIFYPPHTHRGIIIRYYNKRLLCDFFPSRKDRKFQEYKNEIIKNQKWAPYCLHVGVLACLVNTWTIVDITSSHQRFISITYSYSSNLKRLDGWSLNGNCLPIGYLSIKHLYIVSSR